MENVKIVEVGDSRIILDVSRQKAFLITNLFSLIKLIKECFHISISAVKLRNPLKLKIQKHIKKYIIFYAISFSMLERKI